MEELDRPYHFENFVHFSNAVDRLKTFKYKLKKLEDYDAQLVSASLITSSLNSIKFTEYKTRIKNMIATMDEEQFGSCTNTGVCEAECPKEISIENISILNKTFS